MTVKEAKRLQAKAYREYLKNFSPKELEERKQNREYDKLRRIEEKNHKLRLKEFKELAKKEIEVLKFMLKNDVLYYHHSRADSLKEEIKKQLEAVKRAIKEKDNPKMYHPYVWNYYGEGHNLMLRSLLGNLWNGYVSNEENFKSIHDVPLDGSYKFVVFDSGQRGLGSFDYIRVTKVTDNFSAPKVDPGALIPITY